MTKLIDAILEPSTMDPIALIHLNENDIINQPDASGIYPIHYAVDFSGYERLSNADIHLLNQIAILLVEKGAELTHSHEGLLALHYLAFQPNASLEVFKAFIAKNEDLNVQDESSHSTPLHYLISQNNWHIVDFILYAGLPFKLLKNIQNQTPLDLIPEDKMEYIQKLTIHCIDNAPEITFENYKVRVEQAKKNNAWEHASQLGEQYLAQSNEGHIDKECAYVYVDLAMFYFYLGELEKCRKYAEKTIELGCQISDSKIQILGMRSMSSYYRASKKFDNAYTSINEALSLFRKSNINDEHLEGVLWHNKGAAIADNPIGKYNEAYDCFQAAENCFQKISCSESACRTKIRLMKLSLTYNDCEKAEYYKNSLIPIISQFEGQRVQIHYLMQCARLGMQTAQSRDSAIILEQAKLLAEKHNARIELEEINNLLLKVAPTPTLTFPSETQHRANLSHFERPVTRAHATKMGIKIP